jgi:ABC-type transport system involved in multi-copper enzyme maturation permease subunit
MTTRTLTAMIRADLLKLRKKRSITGWALVLTAGIMLVFYVYSLIQHASDPSQYGPAGGLDNFSNAFTSLGRDFGTVAAIFIGAEAGAGEIADRTLKEHVVTGRSRLALFAARIPAALILTLAIVGLAMGISIVMTFAFAGGTATPSAELVLRSVGWVVLCNTVVCVVAVGLGALSGSRPATLISLLAFETIGSRLLLQATPLGSARRSVLDAALTQLQPGPHNHGSVTMPALTAAIVVAAWAAVATGLGAWRMQRRDL